MLIPFNASAVFQWQVYTILQFMWKRSYVQSSVIYFLNQKYQKIILKKATPYNALSCVRFCRKNNEPWTKILSDRFASFFQTHSFIFLNYKWTLITIVAQVCHIGGTHVFSGYVFFILWQNIVFSSVIQILFTEFYHQLHMKHSVHAPDFIKPLCNKGKDLLIFHLLPSFLVYWNRE